MRVLYTVLLYLVTPLVLLRLAWRGLALRDYWGRWNERFGFVERAPVTALVRGLLARARLRERDAPLLHPRRRAERTRCAALCRARYAGRTRQRHGQHQVRRRGAGCRARRRPRTARPHRRAPRMD